MRWYISNKIVFYLIKIIINLFKNKDTDQQLKKWDLLKITKNSYEKLEIRVNKR